MNPQRVCRMCARLNRRYCQRSDLARLVRIARTYRRTDQGDRIMRWLEDEARECPACMLAAIRQSGCNLSLRGPDGETTREAFPFEFKEAVKRWWENQQEEDERESWADIEAGFLGGAF